MGPRFPMRCGSCRERQVDHAILPSYTAEYLDRISEGEYETVKVSIEQVAVLQCGNCKNIILTDPTLIRLDDSLREATGRLPFDQIRHLRELLGRTKEQMAEFFGVSVAQVTRWEEGGQFPTREEDRRIQEYLGVCHE